MTQPDQAAATADLGAVFGTPTFFINGQRHYGSYDVDSLKQAVRTARVDLLKVPPIRHHAHSLLRVGLVTDNNRRAPVFHPASPCPKVPVASRSGEPGHAAMAASARAVRTACFSESTSEAQ